MLSMMKPALQLSWKQKLTAVIVITLSGLIFVSGSAYIGLKSVTNSVQKQQSAAEYKQLAVTFAYQLLSLQSNSKSITPENEQAFLSQISELLVTAESMQQQAQNLDYAQLIANSDNIASLAAKYKTSTNSWLEINKVLGFSEDEGIKKELLDTFKVFEEYKIVSSIEKIIFDMAVSQKEFLSTKQKDKADIVDKNLKDFETVIEEFDWQEEDVGIAVAKYRQLFDQISELILQEATVSESLATSVAELNGIINKQESFLDDQVIQQVIEEANNSQSSANSVVILASLVVALITLLSLGAIAFQLNLQLTQIQAFLNKVAGGDFSGQLVTNDNENDEFTQLRFASNHMVEDIAGVIAKVVKGNESLLSLREQLEKAVAQLASTSEEVEIKTQQSTTSTQQISIAVNDVAKRSVGVSETAQSASKATKKGGSVIKDCVDSIVDIANLIATTNEEVSRLGQSSSKMLGIIDVINGLADQTNLLALNAAIESARAGEAGRGFSVVADEVRALAQKTVSATGNIGDIIKDFNEQSKRMGCLMEKGTKLAGSGQENANNAITSFESIEDAIQQVAAEMDQVVVAVEEISYNSNDIAAQVEQICDQGEINKQTRLSMEEHTKHLSSQAEELGELTKRFVV